MKHEVTPVEQLVGRPVKRSVRTRTVLAVVSVLVVTVGVLFGANVAQADSVQVQSYQRAGQIAACTAQPSETPWQTSWGTDASWYPSWEQWANAGKGGWTCTRSITWARTAVPASGGGGSSSTTYSLGSTGPGGGVVFLISGGKTYEMAPKTWDGGADDPVRTWCNDTSLDVPGAVDILVGTGADNTTAIVAACASGAGNSARAYRGGGLSDWFLPSKDELNAMCNFSRNPSTPSTGTCAGDQQPTPGFSAGDYAFTSGWYWSSSQGSATNAWVQDIFVNGAPQVNDNKFSSIRVRPVRAF